jgi:CRISPR type III-B/RAMP module-associated protein Cmr3
VPTYTVTLEAVDPLLFGDNRSARAGEDHTRSDQDPLPATLYGALGARIAAVRGARGERDWAAKAEPVLGPFSPDPDAAKGSDGRAQLLGFAARDAQGETWFPKPAHLRIRQQGDLERGGGLFVHDLLVPEKLEILSSLPAGLQPLGGTAGDPDDESEEELLVSSRFLGDLLAGPLSFHSESLRAELRSPDDLYRPEPRLGLAIDNRRNVAREGHLFSRPYRRYRAAPGAAAGGEAAPWCAGGFTAWYRTIGARGAEPAWDGLGFLGGDRRRVELAFEPLPESDGVEARPLAELCERAASAVAGSRGFLLYLLTPAPVVELEAFRFAGLRPVGAAAGKPRYVSGWNAAPEAQGPRGLLAVWPAGSVFFFEWGPNEDGDEARRAWVEEQWLKPLSDAHPCTGLGRVLVGVWR